jgi:hypothetical protein
MLCRLILLILARPTFGPNPFVSSFLSKICQFPNKIDILSFVSSLHSLPSKNVSLFQAGQFRVDSPPSTVNAPGARAVPGEQFTIYEWQRHLPCVPDGLHRAYLPFVVYWHNLNA